MPLSLPKCQSSLDRKKGKGTSQVFPVSQSFIRSLTALASSQLSSEFCHSSLTLELDLRVCFFGSPTPLSGTAVGPSGTSMDTRGRPLLCSRRQNSAMSRREILGLSVSCCLKFNLLSFFSSSVATTGARFAWMVGGSERRCSRQCNVKVGFLTGNVASGLSSCSLRPQISLSNTNAVLFAGRRVDRPPLVVSLAEKEETS
jgi:hypothetical protein